MKSPDKGAIHHSRGQAPEGCAARGKRTKQTAPDKGATIRLTRARFTIAAGKHPKGAQPAGNEQNKRRPIRARQSA